MNDVGHGRCHEDGDCSYADSGRWVGGESSHVGEPACERSATVAVGCKLPVCDAAIVRSASESVLIVTTG